MFAQVTHYKKNDVNCRKKIEKLKHYENSKSRLVFFCDCKELIEEGGILFVPTARVFDWLESHKDYFSKLVGSLSFKSIQ